MVSKTDRYSALQKCLNSLRLISSYEPAEEKGAPDSLGHDLIDFLPSLFPSLQILSSPINMAPGICNLTVI